MMREQLSSLNRMELAYQIKSYISRFGLSRARFAQLCGIDEHEVILALDEEHISEYCLSRILSILELDEKKLDDPPLYEKLFQMLLDYCEKGTPIDLILKDLEDKYTVDEILRDLRWLQYITQHVINKEEISESELREKCIALFGCTPSELVSDTLISNDSVAFYSPIQDSDARRKMAEKYLKARKDLDGN